jgi:hypothetical protein
LPCRIRSSPLVNRRSSTGFGIPYLLTRHRIPHISLIKLECH